MSEQRAEYSAGDEQLPKTVEYFREQIDLAVWEDMHEKIATLEQQVSVLQARVKELEAQLADARTEADVEYTRAVAAGATIAELVQQQAHHNDALWHRTGISEWGE